MDQHEQRMIRAASRGFYDLQKCRIQTGLRLVTNFKAKLGIDTTKKESEQEAAKVLKAVVSEYKLISDAAATIKIKDHLAERKIISNMAEFGLVSNYHRLVQAEASSIRDIGKMLRDIDVYREFLVRVRGCGPTMSAAIISEVKIDRAKYPSSLWCLAGLDVVHLVPQYYDHGKVRRVEALCLPVKYRENTYRVVRNDNRQETIRNQVNDEHFKPIFLDTDLQPIPDDALVYTHQRSQVFVLGPVPALAQVFEYTGEMVASGGRSKRREHLVDAPYVNKDGVLSTKKSVTFNPWLNRTMWVLGGCLIKAGGSYKDIYDDYKHRMEHHSVYGTHNDGKKHPDRKVFISKMQRHRMAQRHMMKIFLIDLYNAWRPLEGLRVYPSYAEAKLGYNHGERGVA